MDREFETELARELFFELSALIDVEQIKRRYISQKFIWRLWKRVYRRNFAVTRFFLLPKQ